MGLLPLPGYGQLVIRDSFVEGLLGALFIFQILVFLPEVRCRSLLFNFVDLLGLEILDELVQGRMLRAAVPFLLHDGVRAEGGDPGGFAH